MKKVLSLFLTFCMLFALAIPAFAEENAESALVIESTTAAPGGTFTVPVLIQGNPGLSSIVFTVKYDTSAMTLTNVENAGLFAKMTPGNNIMLMNDVDVADDGVLVNLTFTVNATAALGNYEITATVRETCNAALQENFPFTNASATVTLKDISSEITYANMTLGTDITVNYYANLKPTDSAAQMKFTLGNTETVVEGVATENAGEYLFAYKGLAPQCMGDNIKAELILGDEVLDTYNEYSVLAYCNTLLSSSASSLGLSAEKYAALTTLVADMLEYGAMAQLYRGYKVSALVNAGITGKTEFVELDDSYEIYIEESTLDDIYMTAAGVYFDYTNSLYFKFTAPALTDEDCYLLITNLTTDEELEYLLSDCTLVDEATSTYMLMMDPSSATNFETVYSIDLYAPNSRGKVRVCQNMEYGIVTYVHSMQNKVDESGELTPMAKLARATYNYGASASAYNAIAN